MSLIVYQLRDGMLVKNRSEDQEYAFLYGIRSV